MRKLLTFLFAVGVITVNAQITLDQAVPSELLEKTVLSGDGAKLFYYKKNTSELILQNMDKTIYKTILVPKFKSSPSISYVSDGLFDTDSKIEYLVEYYNNEDSIIILNEDGKVLLNVKGNLWNDPVYDLIIAEKTKLVVRTEMKDSSYVFNLPGKYEPINSAGYTTPTLQYTAGILSISGGNSVDISSLNSDEQKISLRNDTLYLTNGGSVYIGQSSTGSKVISLDLNGQSSSFPNPANNSLQVKYQLPSTENNGTIELINNQGVVKESINVYDNNGIINLDLSDYLSGQYFIKLYTNNGFSSVNKALIIK